MQLPNQKLTRAQKIAEYGSEEDWGKAVMDSLFRLSGNLSIPSTQDFLDMQVNIDLYNSIFHQEDLERVLAPFAQRSARMDYPATPQNYNIIKPKIDLLLGEEIKRPFNFKVVSTTPESVTQAEEKKKAMIFEMMQNIFLAELQAQGVDLENPEIASQIQTPEEIEKYIQYSYSDMREALAQHALTYLLNDCRLEFKFNKGWKDYLLTGTEIYYTGIVSGEPVCYNVDPRHFYCQLSPELPYIEEAQWAYYERFMTPSQIYDELYEYLSDEDVEKIEAMKNGVGFTTISDSNVGVPVVYSNQEGTPSYNTFNTALVRVTHCVWKGLRKIGFITIVDDQGKEQEEIVDESFSLTPDLKAAGVKLEWKWINEVWEGTKVGQEIYLNIRPLPNQHKSLDNPSKCKLPYTGVYRHKSLVSFMKPHQYLYDVIMYRMELTLARSKDKAFLMDIAQIPRSMGIDTEKWLYYLDALGIAFINSFEEGNEKFTGKTSAFNQFQAIDLSLAQQINQYIMMLDKIEAMLGEISGVTAQRQGQVQSSELVGNVERSVIQSSHITEHLFYTHNEVKRRVMTNLLETAKIAWIEGKKGQYVMDDLTRVYFNVDPGLLNDTDFGVFLSNSTKDDRIKQMLEQMAQAALQNQQARLSDVITIMESDSIVDIKKKLIASEQEMVQSQQAMEQRRLEAEQQQHIELLENEQLNRELKKYEVDENNRVKLMVAGMSGDGVEQSEVPGEDNSIVDLQKLQLDRYKIDKDFSVKTRDLDIKEKQLAQDKQLKEKEIAVKKIAARKKPAGNK